MTKIEKIELALRRTDSKLRQNNSSSYTADVLRDMANGLCAKELPQPPTDLQQLAVEIAAIVGDQ